MPVLISEGSAVRVWLPVSLVLFPPTGLATEGASDSSSVIWFTSPCHLVDYLLATASFFLLLFSSRPLSLPFPLSSSSLLFFYKEEL